MLKVMSIPSHPAHAGYPPGSWFPWDRALDAEEARVILADADHPRRVPLIALILREARPDQVWDWITPTEVALLLPALEWRLGRSRRFWTWLFQQWRRLGHLD